MYSQDREEDIIFRYLNKKSSGIYIDIGAGDPEQISNTFHLYQMGWRGLLIEPFMRHHKAIKLKRPDDVLLSIAISDYDGEIDMCSTVSANTPLYKYYYNSQHIYKVKCLTINTLIKEYPKYKDPDFVSIDIETGEEKLLSKCDFEIFKPELICIEHWCRGTDDAGKEVTRMDYRPIWEHYLLSHYVRGKETAGNTFYLRKGKND